MARILDRLGCWKQIAAEGAPCSATSIREGSSDKELGYVELGYVEKTYGYSHMVRHRASLASAMYDGCLKEPGITFKLGSPGSEVQLGVKPSFTVMPTNGDAAYRVECGVLLRSDGVKSSTRVAMLKELNETAEAKDSGQAAYRIMLTRDQMKSDPDLLKIIDSCIVTRWIGEKKHLIAYLIHNKTISNISIAQPDVNFSGVPNSTCTTIGSKKAMIDVYGDFCPRSTACSTWCLKARWSSENCAYTSRSAHGSTAMRLSSTNLVVASIYSSYMSLCLC